MNYYNGELELLKTEDDAMATVRACFEKHGLGHPAGQVRFITNAVDFNDFRGNSSFPSQLESAVSELVARNLPVEGQISFYGDSEGALFVRADGTVELFDEEQATIKNAYDDDLAKELRSRGYVVEKKQKGLSKVRLKQLLFQALQLLRKYVAAANANCDWKSADDILFSELDMEIGELAEIYDEAGVTVSGASCFEDGESPKDYFVKMGAGPLAFGREEE